MMGYDISYHLINGDDAKELYTDVLNAPENIEAICEKYRVEAFYQEKYKEIVSTAQASVASQSFDSTHGYYLATIQGLICPYYYVRGAAFSFLYGVYPHYRRYTLPLKALLTGFDFQQSIHNEILMNYSSGAYIPPDQVRQLLEDYANNAMVRQELDQHYSHGRIEVFLKALEHAKSLNKGILEACEVIEPNPMSSSESVCYSDIRNAMTEGVNLYVEAANEQVSEALQEFGAERDKVSGTRIVNSGDTYSLEANYANALRYYEDSGTSDPKTFIAELLMGYPDQGKVDFVIGLAYADAADHEVALAHFIAAKKAGCDHYYLHYMMGMAYKGLYRYDDAIAAYQMSAQSYPYYDLAHIRIGDIHEIRAEWQEAKHAYEQAIDINPALPEYFNNLGVYEAKLGNQRVAVQYYQRAVAMRPSYYDANKNMVWELYRSHDYEQARLAAQHGLQHVESKGALYDILGRTLEKLNDQEQAVVYYQKAIDEYPNEPESFSNLALIYQKQKRYEDALAVMNVGIEKNPYYAFGYYRRANAYKKLERFEQSKSDYEKAIELGEQGADIYVFLAIVLSELKQTTESIQTYERAIEVDPGYRLAHFNLAMVFWGVGDEENTLRKLNDTLRIDPNDIQALNSLGKYLRTLKRYGESSQAYEKLLINSPTHKEALIKCAYNYYDVKQYKVAINYFDKVLLIDPSHSDALRLAGVASYYLQDDQAAIDYYTRGLELDDKNDSLFFNRGLCYQNLQQLSAAKSDYEKALAINPDYEKAKNNLNALAKKTSKGSIKGLFGFKKKPK